MIPFIFLFIYYLMFWFPVSQSWEHFQVAAVLLVILLTFTHTEHTLDSLWKTVHVDLPAMSKKCFDFAGFAYG